MLSRYRELTAKIDAFFGRVASRHAADMPCAPGCDSCCKTRLTITAVEASAIRAWAASIDSSARAVIAGAARTRDASACAALDGDGRCRIYDARPLVCRSHGLRIRMRERSLPVITSCALTFRSHGPAAADADCILDQELVSTMLGLIDREHVAATQRPADRVDLATLLSTLDE